MSDNITMLTIECGGKKTVVKFENLRPSDAAFVSRAKETIEMAGEAFKKGGAR